MRVKPFFRWYDLWIGVFIDTEKSAVYICPIPMFGLKIQLAPKPEIKVYKLIYQTDDHSYFQHEDGSMEVRKNDASVTPEIYSIAGTNTILVSSRDIPKQEDNA